MALIYQKSAEKTLILSPREGYQRAFDFGSDWTEMRLGIYFSGVTSAGDNVQAVDESVLLNNAADKICFGIKNSTDTNYPAVAGTTFLGISTLPTGTTPTSRANASGSFTSFAGGNLIACGFAGTTIKTPGSNSVGTMVFPTDVTGAADYCGFFAVKLVITDRGLVTQQVTIGSASTKTISGSDYSTAALRLLINNASYGSRVIDWNDGAAAYAIPDAFYVRMPFYNNRIRISAMRAIRYA